MQTNGKRFLLPALAFALTVGLAACDGQDGKKPAGPVAARVNAVEIPVQQVDFILARTVAAATPPEQGPRIRREILDKLVDQQLAVEQALAKKLDRSPEVLMAIDAARREILARAYIEQLTAGLGKPTPEEAQKYYAEHPPLFAERRIYNIQEIVLPASAGVAAKLDEMLAAGKPMAEIAGWLKDKGIKFVAASATRSAEQIPLELLPRIHALKDGQGLVIDSVQNTTVMRVLASQSVPVTEAAALPRIQQFLGNQRAAAAAERELKQLKAKAKITYQGEFAAAGSGAAATAPNDAGAGAGKGVAAPK